MREDGAGGWGRGNLLALGEELEDEGDVVHLVDAHLGRTVGAREVAGVVGELRDELPEDETVGEATTEEVAHLELVLGEVSVAPAGEDLKVEDQRRKKSRK